MVGVPSTKRRRTLEADVPHKARCFLPCLLSADVRVVELQLSDRPQDTRHRTCRPYWMSGMFYSSSSSTSS